MPSVSILWGSLNALRAERFKMLVAYSTVAQLGYLMLVFPLTVRENGAMAAWGGALYFMLAHACAKASVFFSAGAALRAFGGDGLEQLRGTATRLPLATFAFATAAVSLIGLPPSGGFMAKWMLIQAAIEQGLEVLPVLNKMDLPQADPDKVSTEIEEIIGLDATDACQVSAKSGLGKARLSRKRTVVKAPFNAVVTEEFVDVGQVVGVTTSSGSPSPSS